MRRFPPSPTLLTLVLALFCSTAAGAASSVPDFCFLHTSDNHLSPQPVGAAPPKPGDRGVESLAWLCEEAAKPQAIVPLNLTTPPPAFVIDTGDLTEYGVINKTWQNFEQIFKPLPVPLFVTPGNHDNTWTGMMQVMRARHGGDHYSFDRFGCHFAGFDSATPQEPLPSIEKRTLEWLAADLARVKRDTPVFLFCHHPLSTSEYASPLEALRLLEVIGDHNVVLLMMGHGHGHRHETWNTLDSVMGGTTSHPVPSIGYNIIFVKDGVLRVAFRYQDPAKPMELTLEKPLDVRAAPEIRFVSPKPTPADAGPISVTSTDLPVRVEIRDQRPDKITARLDASDGAVALSPKRAGVYEGSLPLAGLAPGMHFVRVVAEYGKDKFDRAEEFLFAPAGSPKAARSPLKAGVKAQPLIVGDRAIVATTGGEILSISGAAAGRPKAEVLFDAGVEVLHAPALADNLLYVSAAEKGVHCLTPTGKLVWKCDVGAVVYGTPAVDAGHVYVADMEGSVHSIDRKTGTLAWSKRHASYSVEMPVVLNDGLLYFGAWDGQLYAVSATDGSLKWSKNGPAGHSKEAKFKSRYYAPADCAPIVVGGRLFMTDRAYRLGSYDAKTGEYFGDVASDVAAIGLAADGKGFYARGLSKGLTRYDGEGKKVWSQPDLRMGRFPVAPIEAGGKVYVCSNTGMLTVHDAAGGSVLLRYQATPELHVMAAVAADADGNAYVAGMDGSFTCVATSSGRASASGDRESEVAVRQSRQTVAPR